MRYGYSPYLMGTDTRDPNSYWAIRTPARIATSCQLLGRPFPVVVVVDVVVVVVVVAVTLAIFDEAE